MSTFNAINLTPQDEQVEAEEHSRELQVEAGYKIFQEALDCIESKNHEGVEQKFQELFDLSILTPDKWGLFRYTSPTLDRLRFLAYRNRGMYHYAYLLENYEPMSREDIVNGILKVLEDLIEALQHGQPDVSAIHVLVEILYAFKSKKLERILLEHELTSRDNLIHLLYRRQKPNVFPQLELILSKYRKLLEELDDTSLYLNILQNKNTISFRNGDRPLAPLLQKIRRMKTEDESGMKSLDICEVQLTELSWESISSSLRGLLPNIKLSNMLGRNSDPYCEVEDPIEGVKFMVDNVSSTTIVHNTDSEACGEAVPSASTIDVKGLHTETTPDLVGSGSLPQGNADTTSSPTGPKSVKRNSDSMTPQPGRPVAQRSSKRFRSRESTVVESQAEDFIAHMDFFDEIGPLLSELGYTLPISLEQFSLQSVSSDRDLTPIADMYSCYRYWSSWHTDIFTQNELERDGSSNNLDSFAQLRSLLRSNSIDEEMEGHKSVEALPSAGAVGFIAKINDCTPHFHELRFLFLEQLLNEKSGSRLIIKYQWPESLLQDVLWFVLSIESNLLGFISSNIKKYWYMGLSIFELLTDALGQICEDIINKKVQGGKIGDLKAQRNKLERKLLRWSSLLSSSANNDSVRLLYYQWTNYCFQQLSNDITAPTVTEELDQVINTLKKSSKDISMLYPNYKYIPPLTILSAEQQLTKIKIMRSISSVYDESTYLSSSDNHNDGISQLQSMLLKSLYGEKTFSEKDTPNMAKFVSNSSFLLRTRLWYLLFRYYVDNNNLSQSINTYFHVLYMFTSTIFSNDYIEEQETSRIQLLLTTLSLLGQFSLKLLYILKQNNWTSKGAVFQHKDIELLHLCFSLFYTILYFESSSNTNLSMESFCKRVVKSSAKIKDYLLSLMTLMVYFFNADVNKSLDEKMAYSVISFISCLHKLAGKFSFCNFANGYFLDLSETLLCHIINNYSYAQLKQVLWCRYHYTSSGDNGAPEPHETIPHTMDKSSSLPLGIFLVKLQFHNSSPLLSLGGRFSHKQILDSIIETTPNPSKSNNYVIERNKYLVQQYLKGPITARLFENSFKGINLLQLTKPNDSLQEAMDAGVYFLAGAQSMNLYKTRRKLMLARPSELDSIIETLMGDILYNTGRFESWYLLGKCFSYMVENDLIWTSDKLAVLERKRTTARTQRKAILCYLMCLTVFFSKRERTLDEKQIIVRNLRALGRELVSGFYKPMDKLCFMWKDRNNTVRLNEERIIHENHNQEYVTVSDFNIEQAIGLCFITIIGISEDVGFEENGHTQNWADWYYLGKLSFKVDRNYYMEKAFSDIVQSCLLAAQSSSNKDTIIEPHYSLINMCYKSVKAGKITPKKALEWLSKDGDFLQRDESFWTLDMVTPEQAHNIEFYEKIVTLLKHLISVDKKKWHHRPHFRIATILLHEFHDVEGAMKEMENLVSLKGTKNLVNIWKPKFELPGKHFVYAHEYVIFYIRLLTTINDFNSIALALKKIKRFGAGMAYVEDATEFANKSYTDCVFAKLGVDDRKYIDSLLPTLDYQKFLRVSEDIVTNPGYEDLAEEYINGLKLAYQLKKGSNGVTYDNVCLLLYYKCFYLPRLAKDPLFADEGVDATDGTSEHLSMSQRPINSETNDITVPPAPKPSLIKKRVSRKETFDRIKALVEKFP